MNHEETTRPLQEGRDDKKKRRAKYRKKEGPRMIIE